MPHHKAILLFFTLLLGFSLWSQKFEGICRKAYPEGFYDEAKLGQSLCGASTSIPFSTTLYLTVSDGYLYVHSNFSAPGFLHPTKLTSRNALSLKDITLNIFYSAPPSDAELSFMESVVLGHVIFVLDPKMMSDPRFGPAYFRNVKHVRFFCPDGLVREGLKIERGPAVDYLLQYNNQIATRVTNQNLSYLFSELKNRVMDFENVKIISLLENSSTRNRLAADFSAHLLLFDYSGVEAFLQLLLAQKGKKTIIIGHIEEGAFVTLDAAGKVKFRLALDALQTFQQQNNLELILLGCDAALEGADSGPLNKFNSLEILDRLHTTRKTKTVEEFLDSLSFGKFRFVLGQTFFGDNNVSSGTYLPFRMDLMVFPKTGDEAADYLKPPLGTIIFLGLGVSQYLALFDSDFTEDMPGDRNEDALIDWKEDWKADRTDRLLFAVMFFGLLLVVVGFIAKLISKQ